MVCRGPPLIFELTVDLNHSTVDYWVDDRMRRGPGLREACDRSVAFVPIMSWSLLLILKHAKFSEAHFS